MDLPRVNPSRCNGCGDCAAVCCADAIDFEANKAIITDSCIVCLACAATCPNEAISEPTMRAMRSRTRPLQPTALVRQPMLWPPRRG